MYGNKKMKKILITTVVMGTLLAGCKAILQEPKVQTPPVVMVEEKEGTKKEEKKEVLQKEEEQVTSQEKGEKEVPHKEEDKVASQEKVEKEVATKDVPHDMGGHLSLYFGEVDKRGDNTDFYVQQSQFTEEKLTSFLKEYVTLHLDNELPIIENNFALNFGNGNRYLIENISEEGATLVVEVQMADRYGMSKRAKISGDFSKIIWESPLEVPTFEYLHELEEWAEANNVNITAVEGNSVVTIDPNVIYNYEMARIQNVFPGSILYVQITEVNSQQ